MPLNMLTFSGAKVSIIFELTKKFGIFLLKIVKIRVIRIVRTLFLLTLQANLWKVNK